MSRKRILPRHRRNEGGLQVSPPPTHTTHTSTHISTHTDTHTHTSARHFIKSCWRHFYFFQWYVFTILCLCRDLFLFWAYLHPIGNGNMKHDPLLKVGSWDNHIHCVSFVCPNEVFSHYIPPLNIRQHVITQVIKYKGLATTYWVTPIWSLFVSAHTTIHRPVAHALCKWPIFEYT